MNTKAGAQVKILNIVTKKHFISVCGWISLGERMWLDFGVNEIHCPCGTKKSLSPEKSFSFFSFVDKCSPNISAFFSVEKTKLFCSTSTKLHDAQTRARGGQPCGETRRVFER